MLAREAHAKPDRIKIAILLSAVGPEALERVNHFKWDVQPVAAEGGADHVTDGALEDAPQVLSKDIYVHVVRRFEQGFAGRKCPVFSRHQFWDHHRSEGQSLSN